MDSTSTCTVSPSEIERRFDAVYPEIDSRAARMGRRYRDPEEAAAEARAFMWADFVGAARKGRWLRPGDLAFFAAKQLRCARTLTGNSVRDALSPQTRARRRFQVLAIPARGPGPRGGVRARASDEIIEALTTNAREGVPCIVATRLDWRDFLDRLPRRTVRIVSMLAEGHKRKAVARRVGVTPGRLTQILDPVERDAVAFFDLDGRNGRPPSYRKA